MKDHAKLDPVSVRDLGQVSRGERRSGLVSQDEESVCGTGSMSKLQAILILTLEQAV